MSSLFNAYESARKAGASGKGVAWTCAHMMCDGQTEKQAVAYLVKAGHDKADARGQAAEAAKLQARIGKGAHKTSKQAAIAESQNDLSVLVAQAEALAKQIAALIAKR